MQPEFVLTHSLQDPYNFDHPLAAHFAQEARIVAQAHGHEPGRRSWERRRCFCSSRISRNSANGSRTCCWISRPVWEKKYSAFKVMAAQEHLWEYYERVALQRGVQGARNSNRKMKYGEAYQRVFPQVGGGAGMNGPVVVRNIERAPAEVIGKA